MARLLSVNVGLPRNVPWHGRTVRTGVWKHPVEGPRTVRRLNIDGDGQGDLAGHGGEQRAVLVYQIDSYRYWQEYFGRDDFGYGQFGENFTVEGLPDDEVCIGDRYRIGTAVFEVTQPRVTCYRVGLRMGEPRMAALLVAHHRPGFYFRVITEGRVTAGDEIVKVSEGPEAITVTEIDALLYLPGHQRDDLERVQRIPALSPGWKASLQTLIDQGGAGKETAGGNPALNTAAQGPPPAWPGFRPMRVARIATESRDIFSLTLAAHPAQPLPVPLPGQFLTLRLHPGSQRSPLIRSYSLSGPPDASRYRITVKHEPHGRASGYLLEHVREGDLLDVAAPRGTFTLAPGEGPVLLVSGGVGVTPELAMLHALAAERSPREVWWLHGARNGAERAFAEETRTLLDRLPRARAHVCYSAPLPDDRPGRDYAAKGRLSAARFAELGVPTEAEAYLCGPPSFLHDMLGGLVEYGLEPGRIRTETFGTEPPVTPGVTATTEPAGPPHPPQGPPGPGPSVSFARSGVSANWDPKHLSLLELAEACDVPVRWTCRTGICHTCETGLLSGEVAYSPEPVDPPAEGNALTCCSVPRGEVVLDL
ncbi:MOSC and FAD-binding oxidoreductase domain-containing protein [Streptomyces sulfonofaciens]|uniref:MOSC and FAD-binding oxidoreductase domain-containing protein n=1 Tax=Streptomyces sulfonofaciens TaxID=68272 RepID=UPI001672F31A|nr:MOSC and FAD-binding oxidoreductase domain-containing protein [Streptomyces sulfonofaciens]